MISLSNSSPAFEKLHLTECKTNNTAHFIILLKISFPAPLHHPRALLSMARLVSTHSTYVPGLMKVLTKLSKSTIISTITPARYYKGPSSNATTLELRLTTSTVKVSSPPTKNQKSEPNTGGKADRGSISQKVIARAADSSLQEVFIMYPVGSFPVDDSHSLAEHCRGLLRKDDCKIIVQDRSTAESKIISNSKDSSKASNKKGLSTTEKLINKNFHWLA